jgi:hypothetical protein
VARNGSRAQCLAGYADGTVRVSWDPLVSVVGHGGAVTAAVRLAAPRGAVRIATGGADGLLCVWEISQTDTGVGGTVFFFGPKKKEEQEKKKKKKHLHTELYVFFQSQLSIPMQRSGMPVLERIKSVALGGAITSALAVGRRVWVSTAPGGRGSNDNDAGRSDHFDDDTGLDRSASFAREFMSPATTAKRFGAPHSVGGPRGSSGHHNHHGGGRGAVVIIDVDAESTTAVPIPAGRVDHLVLAPGTDEIWGISGGGAGGAEDPIDDFDDADSANAPINTLARVWSASGSRIRDVAIAGGATAALCAGGLVWIVSQPHAMSPWSRVDLFDARSHSAAHPGCELPSPCTAIGGAVGRVWVALADGTVHVYAPSSAALESAVSLYLGKGAVGDSDSLRCLYGFFLFFLFVCLFVFSLNCVFLFFFFVCVYLYVYSSRYTCRCAPVWRRRCASRTRCAPHAT